jgi:hypothetical protein
VFKLREHRAEGRMSSCLSQLFATNLTLLGTKKASTSILLMGWAMSHQLDIFFDDHMVVCLQMGYLKL